MSKKLICYTDGGAKPNPGFTGYGVHGYTFLSSDLGKGTSKKPSSHQITNRGYRNPAEVTKLSLEKVSPLSYIDMYGGIIHGTNNYGELMALCKVFEYTLSKDDITELHILADSKYVLLWLEKGLKNKVYLEDTTPNKNLVDLMFNKYLKELMSKGVVITSEHVFGHSEVLGNEFADILATMGIDKVEVTREAFDEVKEYIIAKNNYWNRGNDIPDILTGKRLYVIMDRVFNKPTYEAVTYDEDKFIGSSKEAGYSIVRLPNAIEVIEDLKIATHSTLKGVLRPFIIHLDTLRSNKFSKWYEDFKLDSFKKIINRNVRFFIEKTIPVVVERRTNGIKQEAIIILNELHEILDISLGNKVDSEYEVIDVTSLFYNYDIVKKVFTIKPEITNKVHMVNFKYDLDGKFIDIPISLTTDICNRNVLKRIEKEVVQVNLVIRKLPIRLVYNTTIELKDGTEAIWSSMNMNNIFFNTVKKSRSKPYIFKK